MYINVILIIIALIIIACVYNVIKNAIRKRTAKRRLKLYPNAVKGFFGYTYQVSLDKEMDIAKLVGQSEELWKEKEREEKQRLSKCNKFKSLYPNGWESWKELHAKEYQDLRIVEKAESELSLLENNFSKYIDFKSWISQQKTIATKVIGFGGYTTTCYIDGIDKFGNSVVLEYPVAHFYVEAQDIKASKASIIQDMSSNINKIVHVAKKISENVIFLILPDCYKYISMLRECGFQALPISEIGKFSCKEKQVFAMLTTVIDKQEVSRISNVVLSNIDTNPLLVAFSFIKVRSDTEYNLLNYKEYFAYHNNENSYSLDGMLELHQVEDAYYFTVKGQKLRTIKKAISAYFNEFDTDTIAERTSRKYKHAYHPLYHNKSAEEIKQMWAIKRNESARNNRKLRDDIMMMLSNKQCEIDETTRHFETFNQEWRISPYRTNWPIYDRESGIVATADCISYTEGKFILYSWVRTDSALKERLFGLRNHLKHFVVDNDFKEMIIRSYYDDGIAGKSFAKLSDCKFTKYSIEQYAIMYILNKNYGIKVDESYIVIMHPTYGTPIALIPDNVSNEVENFMVCETKNNTSKPTVKSLFGEYEEPIVYKNDVESIDLMELF